MFIFRCRIVTIDKLLAAERGAILEGVSGRNKIIAINEFFVIVIPRVGDRWTIGNNKNLFSAKTLGKIVSGKSFSKAWLGIPKIVRIIIRMLKICGLICPSIS